MEGLNHAGQSAQNYGASKWLSVKGYLILLHGCRPLFVAETQATKLLYRIPRSVSCPLGFQVCAATLSRLTKLRRLEGRLSFSLEFG